MNKTVREIYEDYKYEVVKLGLEMKDISLADLPDADALSALVARAQKLEALVDVYAYLLACQNENRRA